MHASIHASTDYSPSQRAAWSPCAASSDAFLARVSGQRKLWVAEDCTGAPAGFIELLPDGYIDRFYCHPAGNGTGSQLYRALEIKAAQAGIAQLRVHASEAARRFFLRRGFTDTGRQQILRNGATLHNYMMTKPLG
ncbi:MAG TPA: GNAT family N-acetyltransferase [Roseovarius sp.]